MTELNNYDALVAHAQELERRIESRERELASIRSQRDEAAAALMAIIRPELERMFEDTAVDKSTYIRDEVREMIRDGEIVVSLDVM